MQSNCARMLHSAPTLRFTTRSPIAPSTKIVSQKARHLACSAAAAKVSDLPSSLQKIVGAFQMVPDPMARYKQLLFYANKLSALPADDHIPSNKVEGCVSQVWVKPELRDDGKVYWSADSDSALTKGLAALLVLGLSGCTPQEIIKTDPSFIEMLGLKQSLTPSRNNGFLNMFKLMQRKSLELMAVQAAAVTSAESSSSTLAQEQASTSGSGNSQKPVQEGIRSKLTEALKPVRLTIIDDSASHAGHAAMRSTSGKAGSSGETHFKVEVVSAEFEGMTLVKRQRWIYQLLEAEFAMGLHALSLDTKAPSELK